MRLVCPNCSAQYEIDASMIPEEGRDVQCSNCGHTWFELPGPTVSEDTSAVSSTASIMDEDEEDDYDMPPPYDLDEDDSFEDDTAENTETDRRESIPDFITREDFEDDSDQSINDWDDDPVESDRAEDAPEVDAPVSTPTAEEEGEQSDIFDPPDQPAEDDNGDDGDDDEGALDPIPAVAAATARRPADAAALDILREEAERELSQRRAPPSEPIETQTEMGLDSIRNRRTPSRALRARMAHLGEEYPEDEAEAAAPEPEPAPKSRPQSYDAYEEPRRDLLPDIEEINSTLKGGVSRAPKNSESVRRSGFRTGFLIMVFLTIAAIFAYAQAPAIARALPQTETTMISYVDWANGVRDWIDGLMGP
ncbi:MAG: zinc-ribbon domain-containing protein [Pseudomonadota bacterium]